MASNNPMFRCPVCDRDVLDPYNTIRRCAHLEECMRRQAYETECALKETKYLECSLCKLRVLASNDQKQRRQHVKQCKQRVQLEEELASCIARSKDLVCAICFETPLENDDEDQEFGLLPNCDHTFCLKCIRRWRAEDTCDRNAAKSCPVCRVFSAFVCPSNFWPKDALDKTRKVAQYKLCLSKKDCRHFNGGLGTCRFRNHCFFRHSYRRSQPESSNQTLEPQPSTSRWTPELQPQPHFSGNNEPSRSSQRVSEHSRSRPWTYRERHPYERTSWTSEMHQGVSQEGVESQPHNERSSSTPESLQLGIPEHSRSRLWTHHESRPYVGLSWTSEMHRGVSQEGVESQPYNERLRSTLESLEISNEEAQSSERYEQPGTTNDRQSTNNNEQSHLDQVPQLDDRNGATGSTQEQQSSDRHDESHFPQDT